KQLAEVDGCDTACLDLSPERHQTARRVCPDDDSRIAVRLRRDRDGRERRRQYQCQNPFQPSAPSSLVNGLL
ncbi:MAG TPA: hypothetical protein PK112_05890, partial [candidate division Zixibacteria bacterium]|nr:hypothetical protein [candidate division Zixibacteria bacterium]